jgi:hypothetical protein
MEGPIYSALQAKLGLNKISRDGMTDDQIETILIFMGTITVISFIIVITLVTLFIVFIW